MLGADRHDAPLQDVLQGAKCLRLESTRPQASARRWSQAQADTSSAPANTLPAPTAQTAESVDVCSCQRQAYHVWSTYHLRTPIHDAVKNSHCKLLGMRRWRKLPTRRPHNASKGSMIPGESSATRKGLHPSLEMKTGLGRPEGRVTRLPNAEGHEQWGNSNSVTLKQSRHTHGP